MKGRKAKPVQAVPSVVTLEDENASRTSSRLEALAVLVAVALPLVLYLPTLGFGFVFDDRPLLINNPIVRSPQGFGEFFTTDLDPGARTSESPSTNYLRPLFVAGAALLYRMFGEDPRGWHGAAIAAHALLAGLAFVVLRRELGRAVAALAATLAFAFHPTHVQSTAWVSGLQDLLFGVTSVVAFLAYRRSVEEPRPTWPRMLLLGATFAIALLSKEPAIGLLLFVAAECAGWIPGARQVRSRKGWPEFIALTCVTGLYFAYRVAVLGTLAHRFPTAPPLPQALASIPVALLAYGRDLVWPVDLFLLHPARPVTGVVTGESLLSAFGLLAVVLAGRWVVVRRPALARPFFWIAAWLAPVLAVWAVNPEWMVMDRYLLLPSLGVPWALALLMPIDGAQPASRRTVWVVLVVAWGSLSLVAMRSFENEDRFWSAAIRADPRSGTAWTEWARKRSEAGDFNAAERALRQAVDLDPSAQLPRLRQALLALGRGDVSSATLTLKELIDRNPGYLPAWRNLVVSLSRSGDSVAAQNTLSLALERFPKDPLLWTQQAILLRQAGRLEDALVAVRRAAALAPGDTALAQREAQLLNELGR